MQSDVCVALPLRPNNDYHRARVVGTDRRWHEEDRIPPDQALLDETFREGLNAIRTAAAERDESASARGYGSDPQDREGSAGGRIPLAHQEGLGIQTLEQAKTEAEAVSPAT